MSLAEQYVGDGSGINAAHRREVQGRVGRDETGRLVRSFHLQFSSVLANLPPSQGWRKTVNYAAREGTYAEGGEDAAQAADVVHVAGSTDALREACEAIQATARRRRGPTAERIVVKAIQELPSDMDDLETGWTKAAEAIVADWKSCHGPNRTGHEAVAAVHLHGEERDHPHLHVVVAARPVRTGENGAKHVDRTRRLLVGKDEMRDARQRMAELINGSCKQEIPFHAGKLKEIGIEREPKKRIAMGIFLRARRLKRHPRAKDNPQRLEWIDQAAVTVDRKVREPRAAEHRAAWEAAQARKAEAEARGEAPPEPSLFRQAVARAEESEAGEDAAREELRSLNERQTAYVTDRHAALGLELPDLTTEEGQSAAWSNVRAAAGEAREQQAAPQAPGATDDSLLAYFTAAQIKEAKERKRKAEAKTEAAGAKTERQQASGEIEEDPAGKIAAVTTPPPDPKIEEPAPAAVARTDEVREEIVVEPPPKPAKPSRPAWQLPPGELMAAGHELLEEAQMKWGVGDNSPSSMPLEGLADNPVLTFEPEAGVFRKRPAAWRYEDEGRYAGDKAIRIPQTEFRDRDTTWPDWDGGSGALLRVLVTDALEDGAERPGWLQNTFPDLDEKYGPSIRTKNWYGENARTYEGEMSGGEPHGHGVMTWGSGGRYEGQWKDGRRHGQGVYMWGADTKWAGERYEGDFVENVRTGQGRYAWPDGKTYEGDFVEGKRHGRGVEIAADGTRTEGEWNEGKRVERKAPPQKAPAKPRKGPSQGGGLEL